MWNTAASGQKLGPERELLQPLDMRLLLTIICCVNLHFAAHAVPVYSSGNPALDGVETTEYLIADNFKLSSDATIRAMTFWTIEDGSWDGRLDWYIFANNPNSAYEIPGELLYAGNGSQINRTDTGRSYSIYDEVEWTFNLGQDVTLSAGTKYWIGLHLSGDYDRDHLYWEDNGDLRMGFDVYGYSVRSEGGTMNNWVATAGYDLAFTLHDSTFNVPDAGATVILLLPGSLLLFFIRSKHC
jgi:hypothetical protein